MFPASDARAPKTSLSHLQRAGAAAGVLGLAAVVAWGLRTPRARPTPTAAPPPSGCRFAVDDLRAWRLTQRTAEGSRERVDATVELTTRTLAVDARTSSTRHAARFTAVASNDPALRAQLAALRNVTFALHTEADCTLSAMGFGPGVTPESAAAARTMIRAFEVVMPTGAVPARWSAQQREGAVDVSVRYARVDGGAFTRTRVRYLGLGAGIEARLMPEILRASARFTMARDGRWLDALDGAEETRVTAGPGGRETVRSELELRAVEPSWAGEAPSLAALDAMDYAERPVAPPPDAGTTTGPTDPALALALEPAVAHLGVLFDGRRSGAADEAVRFFVAYLQTHPERAVEILAMIRRRAYPERLGAVTFFAMSKVRDPRVRDALVRVVEDEGHVSQDRVRASFALADGESADVAAVDRLARVASRAHATPDEEIVTDAARNAIGTLRAHATGEVAEAATAALRRVLDEARTPEAVVDAMDAIGNSGDTSFLGAAREAASSDDPRVRESAATAIGAMDDASVEGALRERLRVETTPAVVIALVRAIARRTERRPSDDTVAVAVARLPATPDVDARLALVELIGCAVGWNGAARSALAQWFPREEDPRVKVALGRYLPAEALTP
jgi:hypothetical protein